MPTTCPCDDDCYCKEHSCKSKWRPDIDEEQNQQALIDKWKKEVYYNPDIEESGEQYCFESLATGFFMAHGKTNDEAYDLYQKCIKQNCF